MLPVGSTLGVLRIVEVLDYVDKPVLFVARDAIGFAYLALWIRESVESDGWYYLPISEDRLAAVRAGDLPLRDAFLAAENGFVMDVTVTHQGPPSVQAVPADRLETHLLPPEEDCLDPHDVPPRMPAPSVPRILGARKTVTIERVGAKGAPPLSSISEVWHRWLDVLADALSACGFRGGRPEFAPAASAIASFSVEIPLQANAHYPRSITKVAETFRSLLPGRDPLPNDLDTHDLAALLRALQRDSLVLRVLFHEGATETAALEIGPVDAEQIVASLNLTRTILGSHRVPQADDLKRLYRLVELASSGAVVDASSLGVTPRQLAYYRHAAKLLRYISTHGDVTRLGERLMSLSTLEARHALTAAQFERTECGWTWTRWAQATALEGVSASTAQAFLTEHAPSLSPTTRHRRAQTLAAWHVALFPRQQSLIESGD